MSDYKTHLKIALVHLEKAEVNNPRLGPLINEVAKVYRGRPKLRKNDGKQLNFLKTLDVSKTTKFK